MVRSILEAPHDPLQHGSGPKGPDADQAPAPLRPVDRPVDSGVPRARRRPDRGTVTQRFAAQRDAEATRRMWHSAAVGGGPGLR
jgi:hypothetical protein